MKVYTYNFYVTVISNLRQLSVLSWAYPVCLPKRLDEVYKFSFFSKYFIFCYSQTFFYDLKISEKWTRKMVSVFIQRILNRPKKILEHLLNKQRKFFNILTTRFLRGLHPKFNRIDRQITKFRRSAKHRLRFRG